MLDVLSHQRFGSLAITSIDGVKNRRVFVSGLSKCLCACNFVQAIQSALISELTYHGDKTRIAEVRQQLEMQVSVYIEEFGPVSPLGRFVGEPRKRMQWCRIGQQPSICDGSHGCGLDHQPKVDDVIEFLFADYPDTKSPVSQHLDHAVARQRQ